LCLICEQTRFAAPTHLQRELRATYHAATEANDYACARFAAGALSFPVPIAPSDRICDVRDTRLRNNVLRSAGDVGDFLRGRRSNAPGADVGPRADALG